jgi:hypothetical protein
MGAGGNGVVASALPLARESRVAAYPSLKHAKEFGTSTCGSLLLLPPWGVKGRMRGACREPMHRKISTAPSRGQAAPKIQAYLRLRPCLPPPSPQPKGGEGAGCDELKGPQKLQASPC